MFKGFLKRIVKFSKGIYNFLSNHAKPLQSLGVIVFILSVGVNLFFTSDTAGESEIPQSNDRYIFIEGKNDFILQLNLITSKLENIEKKIDDLIEQRATSVNEGDEKEEIEESSDLAEQKTSPTIKEKVSDVFKEIVGVYNSLLNSENLLNLLSELGVALGALFALIGFLLSVIARFKKLEKSNTANSSDIIINNYYNKDNDDKSTNSPIEHEGESPPTIIEKEKEKEKFGIYFEAYDNGDYKKAFNALKPIVEEGDAKAQTSLGFMYEKGDGVEQSYEKAVKWYRKAAEQGNARAQNNLGVMYNNGTGVGKNYQEAVKLYQKAAEQGDALAQSNIGVMYRNGQGVLENYELAVTWFLIAKANGDEWAANFLENVPEYITDEIRLQAQKLADKMVKENPLLLQSNHEQKEF